MKRRKSREEALKLLYQGDIQRVDVRELLEQDVLSEDGEQTQGDAFSIGLVEGVMKNRLEIDEKIKRFAIDWSLERMSPIDRNVLRIAVYEILYCDDIPIGVSINEAVELAKKYSTETSGKFVNGILGKISKQ